MILGCSYYPNSMEYYENSSNHITKFGIVRVRFAVAEDISVCTAAGQTCSQHRATLSKPGRVQNSSSFVLPEEECWWCMSHIDFSCGRGMPEVSRCQQLQPS